jgi:hypothetical protein
VSLGMVVVEIIQRLERDQRAIGIEVTPAWSCGEKARVLDTTTCATLRPSAPTREAPATLNARTAAT